MTNDQYVEIPLSEYIELLALREIVKQRQKVLVPDQGELFPDGYTVS